MPTSSWACLRRTRSRAEGDGRSPANKVRLHGSGSSRHQARGNPRGRVGGRTEACKKEESNLLDATRSRVLELSYSVRSCFASLGSGEGGCSVRGDGVSFHGLLAE